MKRSAEASVSSVTMSATETKKFKKALEPLQKAVKDFINTMVKNMPAIVKAITPVVNFVADHGKLILELMTAMLALNFTGKAINGLSKLHDAVTSTISVAQKVKDSKAFKWTASLGKKAFTKSIGAIKTVALGTGKLIGKSLKFTASIATKGANLAMAGLVKTAKATGTGITLAFNFLKANPLILLVTAITAVVVALVELYKHNKKFRQFVDGLVKSAKQFFEGITKWFGNAWSSVTKGYNSFTCSFSKGWHSFTDGIGKAWNNTWSYVSNVFDKYINIYKRVIKTFTDFFTGNWGNLGKDIRGIWNALWDYVESIFGKKAGSIKHGIENFGSSVWNLFGRIKDKVSGFWSDMWNGLKDFARDGINNVIGVINNGIGGINTVIHTFGGKKEAIGKIPKFANGTKGAPKGLAIVNDAPGEHYQEAIIDNSGRATVLEGRNRLVNFSGGETVIPAHALPKFAHGTDNWLDTAIGWIKDKWDKLIEFIAHPIKALGNIMNKAVSGIAGSPLVTNIAPAMPNGLVQGIADPIVNLFKSLKKKHDDEGASAPAGSGVQRWKDLVIKALDKNGLSTSESMVNKVLRQIQSESGGNEKAVQGGYTDINTITGDLAKGLMQTISATFNAYAFPGHKNIFNGYDNLLAALAYAKNRYGSNLAGLGEGHGYAQGGIVSQHGFYEVAEQNMPEIIIPLDPAKKMRANELLAEANQRINGAQSQQVVVQSDTTQLEQKFDNVISLLSLMLGVNQDQLKAMQSQGGINLPNLMNQMGMAQATHNYQSI
ncbi:transglycosylase SLT domain-containing protein [Weissella confusa]|nr:transglycosylase SLT domain-containing protein [Weissella confusa]